MPDRSGGPTAWDGEAYVAQSSHHRRFDDWFLASHPPRADDDIVDVGSGSGEFTGRLAACAPQGTVIGVEPDPSMLATARGQVSADHVEFRQGSAQALDEVVAVSSADLVVSRSVFHWIPLADYLRCYRAIYRVLRPGGRFHAESAGTGNVRRIVELMDPIAQRYGLGPAEVTFPDVATVLELLEQAGFEVPEQGVRTIAQRRAFDRDSLRGFLETQAAVAYLGGVDEEQRASSSRRSSPGSTNSDVTTAPTIRPSCDSTYCVDARYHPPDGGAHRTSSQGRPG